MMLQRSSEYEANGARDRRIALTPMAPDTGSPWNPWWFVVGALGTVLVGLVLR
jgi:hypothetical protein